LRLVEVTPTEVHRNDEREGVAIARFPIARLTID